MRSPSPRSPVAPLLATFLAAHLAAQSVETGYRDVVATLPGTAGIAAAIGADHVWFDGNDLWLERAGQNAQSLLHFGNARFGSFALPLTPTELLFAESSNDELWLVPLQQGGTPRLLATVPFAYDAVPLGTNRVLVSARTGGFGAGANELIAVDLASGATSVIGRVAGASGPLAIAADGELYYATAPTVFPPPAGAVSILRWTAPRWALALAGGPLLTELDGTPVATGIDSAADLALDGDDDLFFVDYLNARVTELSDVHGAATASTLVDYAGVATSPVSLQFVPAAGPAGFAAAPFEPFAVGCDSELAVFETDFATAGAVRRARPRPAALGVTVAGTVPAGPFGITLQDATTAGNALFVLGTLTTGTALSFAFPGYETPIAWDTGLLYPIAFALAPCSPLGMSVLGVTNPGFPQGLAIHCQAVFAGSQPRALGATEVLTIPLGP